MAVILNFITWRSLLIPLSFWTRSDLRQKTKNLFMVLFYHIGKDETSREYISSTSSWTTWRPNPDVLPIRLLPTWTAAEQHWPPLNDVHDNLSINDIHDNLSIKEHSSHNIFYLMVFLTQKVSGEISTDSQYTYQGFWISHRWIFSKHNHSAHETPAHTSDVDKPLVITSKSSTRRLAHPNTIALMTTYITYCPQLEQRRSGRLQ